MLRIGRGQNPRHQGMIRQPCHQTPSGVLMAGQSDGQSTHTPQRQIQIIRRSMVPMTRSICFQGVIHRFVSGHHHPQQGIGMAHQIFCGCMGDHINPNHAPLKIQGGGPCVVQNRDDASALGQGAQGGNVLHVKGNGPRGLQMQNAGMGTDQGGDILMGVIIRHLHPKAPQHIITIVPHRAIGRIMNQNMIPAF